MTENPFLLRRYRYAELGDDVFSDRVDRRGLGR